jgi:hypothetical protein
MLALLLNLFATLRSALRTRAELALENLALRQQLAALHLLRILKSYFDYYHRSRTHLSLGKDAPEPRDVQPPSLGKIVALPEVGGLHHRYERRAA